MQLESGGAVLLVLSISIFIGAEARSPELWRQQGIHVNIEGDNSEATVLEEALRWMKKIDYESLDKRGTVQEDPKTEEEQIDELNVVLKNNVKKIDQLQKVICDMLLTICDTDQKKCKPCPWPEGTVKPSPASKEKPTPSPDGSCGKPGAPENGYAESNKTTLDALLVLHCNAGFDLIGNDRMICTAIWNEAEKNYQYSWAPPMSVICKSNGKPSEPAKKKTTPLTTTHAPKTTESKGKQKNASTRQQNSVDKREPSSRCLQEKLVGRCRAAFPRFYFDAEEGKCLEFIYGGCGGNENNFRSEKDCLCACSKCP